MDPARCPECGNPRQTGLSAAELCPFCLLGLGLEFQPDVRSPWLDPARWTCRVLTVLQVEGGVTSYLAEQEHPARRLVVLAQLGVRLESGHERSRIEEALTRLVGFDHALVGRVFGGFMSETGAVSLVSEYVPGVPIVRHCARMNTDAAERVALCVSVTEAVRAAHERQIVHGALSPSRVVVASRGSVPTPIVTGLGLTLLARKEPDASTDVAALEDLATALGLGIPAPRCRTARDLADWLRRRV